MNLPTRTRRLTFGLWLAAGCHGGDEATTTDIITTTTTTGDTPTTTTMAATTTVAPTTEAEPTGGNVPTTSGATDVGPTSTASGGTDTTSTSADTTTDTMSTDADTTTIDTDTGAVGPCPLPTPIGEDAMGLIVEPCEVLGDPLRAEDFNSSLKGFAIDTKGAILVNLTDQATIRLVDSPAPGCELTRAPADDLPPKPGIFDWGWGPIEVLADGVVYEMSPWQGVLDFVWGGAKEGACLEIHGWITSHLVGFRAGQAISGGHFVDYPILYDLNTCTVGPIMKIPVYTRAAMFYDDDVIVVANDRLHRWTLDGVKVWESPDPHNFGGEVVRCGDDICLAEGALGRYSAADGKPVAQYDTLPLFGIGARIDALGTSPDHAAILVGFEVEHPDPECSANNMMNIQFYRVSGF